MPLETMKYSNNEITVVWKPKVCIHSTLCWKGLIEVFNPKERPWIKMDGASTGKIMEQVKKCPSGALSYYLNNETNGPETEEAKLPAAITEIEVSPNGPYLVKSQCQIIHSNGNKEIKTATVALCRCGASANKPYCDGSHRKSGFTG